MKIRFCCRLYNKIMFLLHHHVCNENTIPFVILSMKSYFHSSLSLFESFLSSFLLPLPYMLILPRLILSHTHTHTQRPIIIRKGCYVTVIAPINKNPSTTSSLHYKYQVLSNSLHTFSLTF